MIKKVTGNPLLTALTLVVLVTSGLTTSCSAQKKGGQTKEKGFVSIFDGKTLNNWKGDPTYWRVEDGTLTGEITPSTLLKTNSFIVWQGGEPADFELKGEFKITKDGTPASTTAVTS